MNFSHFFYSFKLHFFPNLSSDWLVISDLRSDNVRLSITLPKQFLSSVVGSGGGETFLEKYFSTRTFQNPTVSKRLNLRSWKFLQRILLNYILWKYNSRDPQSTTADMKNRQNWFYIKNSPSVRLYLYMVELSYVIILIISSTFLRCTRR